MGGTQDSYLATVLTEVLKKLDLDEKEIEAYLTLLRIGQARASVLAYQIGLPRTTTQNILNRLEQDGLVMKSLDQNVALFLPVHPEEIAALLEHKHRKQNYEFEKTMHDLGKVIPELVGLMKTSKAIPNVKFYRGKEGIRKVFWDTLTSKTALKDFANIDAMFKYAQDINDEYVKAREKTTITKRSLLLDTPFARKVYEGGTYSSKSHKGYKWIPADRYPFAIEMNIYDGKISYVTYVEDDFIGVIVENKHVYKMHDSIWNLLWDVLPAPAAAHKK